jgi:hypothetical protein
MDNKVYLIGSDAFYYVALADSFVDTGQLRDITSIPSKIPRFPQNGINFGG